MTSISFSEQQHTPDITHTSTKLNYCFANFILFSNIILMGTVAACDIISNFLQ